MSESPVCLEEDKLLKGGTPKTSLLWAVLGRGRESRALFGIPE